MEERFEVDGQTVTLRAEGSPRAAVYLHVFEGDGADVWERCLDLGCRGFALASIGGASWNDDMAPWDAPALFRSSKPSQGQAPAQLERLTCRIVPAAEAALGAPCAGRFLAGYSLAGLFAVWAAFNARAFAGVASVSGSLWFPGFADYARTHAPSGALERAYFSLGDRESHTPNPVLATVADATQAVEAALKAEGVRTAFESNRGNHFKDEALRCAKGIRWLLTP